MTDGLPVVFDLDDLCPQYDAWDLLQEWKEWNPAGKVTLFTIPRRCDDKYLRRYLDLPWVQLAMHGYWHTLGETLYWTSGLAEARFKEWAERGGAPGFKAAKWIMSDEVYQAAARADFWIADHTDNKDLAFRSPGVKSYIYNLKRRKPSFRAVHGHTWNTSGNGLPEAFERFCFPADTQFKFVSEVAQCSGS